jgi:hypothetical protein
MLWCGSEQLNSYLKPLVYTTVQHVNALRLVHLYMSLPVLFEGFESDACFAMVFVTTANRAIRCDESLNH